MFIRNKKNVVQLHNFSKVDYIEDVMNSLGYKRCDSNGNIHISPLAKRQAK